MPRAAVATPQAMVTRRMATPIQTARASASRPTSRPMRVGSQSSPMTAMAMSVARFLWLHGTR